MPITPAFIVHATEKSVRIRSTILRVTPNFSLFLYQLTWKKLFTPPFLLYIRTFYAEVEKNSGTNENTENARCRPVCNCISQHQAFNRWYLAEK